MENLKPIFKEKEETKEQFYFDNNRWIKCGESKINSLWENWVVSENIYRHYDDYGFLVYGYVITNNNI